MTRRKKGEAEVCHRIGTTRITQISWNLVARHCPFKAEGGGREVYKAGKAYKATKACWQGSIQRRLYFFLSLTLSLLRLPLLIEGLKIDRLQQQLGEGALGR